MKIMSVSVLIIICASVLVGSGCRKDKDVWTPDPLQERIENINRNGWGGIGYSQRVKVYHRGVLVGEWTTTNMVATFNEGRYVKFHDNLARKVESSGDVVIVEPAD